MRQTTIMLIKCSQKISCDIRKAEQNNNFFYKTESKKQALKINEASYINGLESVQSEWRAI